MLAVIVSTDLNSIALGDDLAASLGTKVVRARILTILGDHGPLTHEQIRDRYLHRHGYGRGSSPASIRTRTSELHDLGGVRAVDRNGITPSGRAATRWDIHREEQPNG